MIMNINQNAKHKKIKLTYQDGHTEKYSVLMEDSLSYLVKTKSFRGASGKKERIIWIYKEIDTDNDGLVKIEEL